MEDLFKPIERTTVSIGPGDAGFQLYDGFMLTNRAGINISLDCPESHVKIILQAIDRGWLKPVATVPKTDPTLIWDTLQS